VEERCPGPSSTELIAAAVREAGLEAHQVRSWRRRLAWSNVLPQMSSRLSRTASSGEYLDLRPDSPDRVYFNNHLALQWEIRATWDLARLVFDPNELRVSHQAAKLLAERRRLIERVASLHAVRCRLLKALSSQPSGSSALAVARSLRLGEVEAVLDALSGGLLTRENR
jgi:hypothetical protein